jgi:CheY-like chemotaxis protein
VQGLRDDLQQIAQATERATGLTRQLLTFGRRQILQPQVVDLNAIVGNMQKMLRRLIGEDIELITHLDPALGQVKTDPGQIEQVIMNLSVNARDAMPDGGQLVIETRNTVLDETYAQQHPEVRPGPYVRLRVRDTGTGMDRQTLEHLFEPFFTTKEPGKGTGLGLATVFGIVKQSGGDIRVQSALGHGTSFEIDLPRMDGSTLPSTLAAPASRLAQGSETILLVEDEDSVRALTRRVLESQGYTVLQASHAREALERFESHHGAIHLLVTDVIMPGGISGRGLVERLRDRHAHLRVLYMSGYTDDVIGRYGIVDQETHFIQKPFQPTALARKVREVLDA